MGDEVNPFQIRENLNRFLTACKQLGLAKDDLFEPDDLNSDGNGLKIIRTLQCLRKKSEEGKKTEESRELPSASSAASAAAAAAPALVASESKEQLAPAGEAKADPSPGGLKISALARKRSIRLFDGLGAPAGKPPLLSPATGFSLEFSQVRDIFLLSPMALVLGISHALLIVWRSRPFWRA